MTTSPLNFTDFVLAGIEIARAQFLGPLKVRAIQLEPISNQAGRLLFETGRAPSVDAGIVMFHEDVTRDKPSLRRILRRIDEKAGRRPRAKVSKAQRAVRDSFRAGEVVRQNGRVVRLTPRAQARVRKARIATLRATAARRKKREMAVLRRIGLRR